MDTSYVAVGTVIYMITDSLTCRPQEKLRWRSYDRRTKLTTASASEAVMSGRARWPTKRPFSTGC